MSICSIRIPSRNWDIDEKLPLTHFSKALLGAGGAAAGDGPRVVVKKIELRSDDLKEPLTLDLTLPPEELKKQSFTIKEGADYQLHFFFKVNNEILSGLRYSMVSDFYYIFLKFLNLKKISN